MDVESSNKSSSVSNDKNSDDFLNKQKRLYGKKNYKKKQGKRFQQAKTPALPPHNQLEKISMVLTEEDKERMNTLSKSGSVQDMIQFENKVFARNHDNNQKQLEQMLDEN